DSGRLVCSWTISGEYKVWDIETGKVRLSGAFKRHPAPKSEGSFTAWLHSPTTPDGRLLALFEDNQLRILNFDNLRLQCDVGAVDQHYFSPDNRRLVTLGASREGQPASMKLWDLESGREIAAAPIVFTKVVFSADSRWFLTTDNSNPTAGFESLPDR